MGVMHTLRLTSVVFDKSWLADGKETVLRTMIDKECNGLRYDLKSNVRYYCSQVSCCSNLIAHEALAIRMAFLVHVQLLRRQHPV